MASKCTPVYQSQVWDFSSGRMILSNSSSQDNNIMHIMDTPTQKCHTAMQAMDLTAMDLTTMEAMVLMTMEAMVLTTMEAMDRPMDTIIMTLFLTTMTRIAMLRTAMMPTAMLRQTSVPQATHPTLTTITTLIHTLTTNTAM